MLNTIKIQYLPVHSPVFTLNLCYLAGSRLDLQHRPATGKCVDAHQWKYSNLQILQPALDSLLATSIVYYSLPPNNLWRNHELKREIILLFPFFSLFIKKRVTTAKTWLSEEHVQVFFSPRQGPLFPWAAGKVNWSCNDNTCWFMWFVWYSWSFVIV